MITTIMIATIRPLAFAALIAVLPTVAAAAPAIPSSELPGRERQRFQDSPIDRFTQPDSKAKPLWQWECERPKPKRKKHSRNASKRC
jgi:hypothetical protein